MKEITITIPECCTECYYKKYCRSWYGGSTCKYQAALAQMHLNALEVEKKYRSVNKD